MERDNKQAALEYLLVQAEKQGYVTFDNIMDCAEAKSLPINDFDWLTGAITTRGILVYDEAPSNKAVFNQDDDFDDYAHSDYETVYDRIIELEPSLEPFINDVRNIVPPQRREISQLKYQVIEGNQHARERMIEMHLRIAVRIALQRTETYDMDIVDAVGDACIGLVMAVDKYDPDTNGAFGSYAAMWVLQNISRRQPTQRPLMYYPVHKKEPYFLAYPLLKEAGFVDDLAVVNNLKVYDFLEEKLSFTNEQTADAVYASIPFESFEAVYNIFLEEDDIFEEYEITEGNWNLYPRELICEDDVEEQIAAIMMQEQLLEALKKLNEREQRVLELRYGLNEKEPKTLEEVGHIYNVTRERIRQIETKALRKIKKLPIAKKLKNK